MWQAWPIESSQVTSGNSCRWQPLLQVTSDSIQCMQLKYTLFFVIFKSIKMSILKFCLKYINISSISRYNLCQNKHEILSMSRFYLCWINKKFYLCKQIRNFIYVEILDLIYVTKREILSMSTFDVCKQTRSFIYWK